MSHFRRVWAAVGLWTLGIVIGQPSRLAQAQLAPAASELSGPVTVDEVDSSVRAHLERVKAYVADRQWDEAVETLRQLMENSGGKLVPLARGRYVSLAEYCHVLIASLPDEALALYRERVDPLAQQWYEQGLAKHNAARLADVVDRMFCSSWGDDALLALGEIELEQGHYTLARSDWQRLIEVPPARVAAARFEAARHTAELPAEVAALVDKQYALDSALAPRRYELRGGEALSDEDSAALVRFWKSCHYPFSRLSYPGTSLPLADVRARLVLVSIREGALDRARDELHAFERLHPTAQGMLAGREVRYAPALADMIAAAEQWSPPARVSDDWPTFAGSPERSKVVARSFERGPQAWQPINLGETVAADAANSRAYSLRRVGEDPQHLLSYHPVITGDLVLFNNQHQIFAFNLKTGQPAWAGNNPERANGEIFNGQWPVTPGPVGPRGLGAPRFTMTVHDNKLYARMGSPVTGRPLDALEVRGGYLVCLDLAAEGRVVWKLPDRTMSDDDKWAHDEKWAFEGSPLVDGSDVYVAMRKSDVRPQAHVACFDAVTRRLRWRTMICASETPGGGQTGEITHNLLTLAEGVLYYNTNLGAVAALSARDGRLQWVSVYPRAGKTNAEGQDRRAAHFYRDLNPCVYYRGLLLVAPADCELVLALDAATGETIWESSLPEDAVHLLGVGHGNLLASGDSLWWIDARSGKVLQRWPDTTPLGYGRGVLMGDDVIWPTRDALYVLDQRASARDAAPREPISFGQQRPATGGNLVAAGGVLLIATGERLYGFVSSAPAAASADRSTRTGAAPRH